MRIKTVFSLLLILPVVGLFTACEEDELAFDIIESPVLAVFEDMDADPGFLKVKATFYELDKSGILDHNVGIDSIPVASLPVSVFVYEDEQVGDLTTDANGEVIFEKPLDELLGAGRLEWVGNYAETPFRIYKNY